MISIPNCPEHPLPTRPRWARALIACALLALAPAAFAGKSGALYKCVTAAGVISIQSDACPAGTTQAWRRDATPEPAPTPEQAAQVEAKRQRDQELVRDLSEQLDKKLKPSAPEPPPAAAAPPPVPADPCHAAQAFADSVREKEWLGLSDDQVQRLYAWVAEQCKAPPARNN
jgi:hypothetical protein